MEKRIIAVILSLLLSINIFTLIPIKVDAANVIECTYDGYTVTYEIQSEWANSKSIRIGITNTDESSIVNWGLKYNFNGTIDNIWDAEVYSHNADEYILRCTNYNYEIKPNQTVYFGYIASGENMTDPQSFEVCSKEIIKADGYSVKTNILSQWTNGFVAEVIIANATDIPIRAWKLDFETECQITNVWNASVVNLSENKYTIACATETFEIPANGQIVFGMQGVCGATPEFNNYVLHEVVTDGSEYVDEEIDYELDTDSDGLPDYYEEIIGSDPKTEHSDDDQLPDEYEALYLGTDPSKSDSDDNGTSDADEDFDTDGLTNLEEYNLGTAPFLEDSDYDTLSDKDEVNIHSTNPTKSDTDDDLVPDGDEVKLGLDPNSGSTNGTPDSERTFSQVVTAESEVLAAVNDDSETPFDVSLEITAAGVAESNVYARESGYSNAIENPSIIGVAPEFVYTDGLEVEEVTVKFELDNTIINNTLGTYTAESDEFKGIKRLNVFMFFEDVNMLLPVETFHDEATNTVYTTTDRMGTYCLVDMELWLDNLGIVPEITEPVEVYSDGEVSVYTDYAEETEVYASGQKYKDNFDVAFLIDARMETNENYANSRRSILEMCDIILTVSPNARIRFIQLLPIETSDGSCYNVLTHGRDNVYFTDYDTICESLSNFEPTEHNTCYVAPGLEYVIDTATRETFCFYILEKDGSKFDQMGNDISNIIGSNVTISVVSDYKDESKKDAKNLKFIPDMCNKTGGQILYVGDEKDYEENITGTYNFKNRGLGVIYGCTPKVENSYKAIIATGYKTVELNSSLQQNYEWYLDSAHYDVFRDTDIDGLCDYEEIRFATHNGRSLIDDSDPNNVKLFTYAQIVDILDDAYSYFDENEKHFYVQDGLKRYMDISGEEGEYPISLLNTYILPINSDPTHEDGDFDGIIDINDHNALSNKIEAYLLHLNKDDPKDNTNYAIDFQMDFTKFFEDESIYYSGIANASLVFAGMAYSKSGAYYYDNKKEHDYYEIRPINVEYSMSITEYMQYLGFENIEEFDLRSNDDNNINNPLNDNNVNNDYCDYEDDHVAHFYIGKKDVQFADESKTIVAVFIRGTTGVTEWISNFDIGSSIDSRFSDQRNDYDNHLGFDVAAYRVKRVVLNYMNDYNLNDPNHTTLWLTGHSRGAAIANIVAAEMIDAQFKTFAYTFATPNNTVKSKEYVESYKGIYNIVNEDDFVPVVPLEDNWGFLKYGKTYKVKMTLLNKLEWDMNMGVSYSAPDSLNELLEAFKCLANNRDECYSGDVITESFCQYVSVNKANSIEEAQKVFLNNFPADCKEYVKIKNIDLTIDGRNWRVDYITSPYVLMHYMGKILGGGLDEKLSTMLFNIGSIDKLGMISILLDDFYIIQLIKVKYPHYIDTYYILTRNVR